MGRAREFDTDRVLLQVMGVFWEKGYEATSVQDLAEAAGVGRGSLYAAFHSKENLYAKALRRYVEQVTEVMRSQLLRQMPIREALWNLLTGRIEDALAVPGRPGCMLVNAVIERVPHDPGTHRIVQDAITALRELLSASLHTARGLGEIPEDANVQRISDFFAMVIQGVRVMSAVYPDEKMLQGIIETALTVVPLEENNR
ncbi:TetR/AcrR family transcriptional regulator [Actinopolyspora saharensis]|uniref:Transcriptional regulator, TetR family n=1 Tax=Actinopolyspora saharensis TaxID=995062 RepID=A0A1H0Z2Z4_9ACTN|nr:TetR/AcrR family transcriptional regulator [Actinopolyspora saharensis]SDQ21852.1 transcriptional regulator, TetR family [Actinopolyspora saharensis]